jgi:hypothetical protein
MVKMAKAKMLISMFDRPVAAAEPARPAVVLLVLMLDPSSLVDMYAFSLPTYCLPGNMT